VYSCHAGGLAEEDELDPGQVFTPANSHNMISRYAQLGRYLILLLTGKSLGLAVCMY
jgi:hypothetical protein